MAKNNKKYSNLKVTVETKEALELAGFYKDVAELSNNFIGNYLGSFKSSLDVHHKLINLDKTALSKDKQDMLNLYEQKTGLIVHNILVDAKAINSLVNSNIDVCEELIERVKNNNISNFYVKLKGDKIYNATLQATYLVKRLNLLLTRLVDLQVLLTKGVFSDVLDYEEFENIFLFEYNTFNKFYEDYTRELANINAKFLG